GAEDRSGAVCESGRDRRECFAGVNFPSKQSLEGPNGVRGRTLREEVAFVWPFSTEEEALARSGPPRRFAPPLHKWRGMLELVLCDVLEERCNDVEVDGIDFLVADAALAAVDAFERRLVRFDGLLAGVEG